MALHLRACPMATSLEVPLALIAKSRLSNQAAIDKGVPAPANPVVLRALAVAAASIAWLTSLTSYGQVLNGVEQIWQDKVRRCRARRPDGRATS